MKGNKKLITNDYLENAIIKAVDEINSPDYKWVAALTKRDYLWAVALVVISVIAMLFAYLT